jgi:tRNA threonylcarbamoyladenosine biosynthesis protein TsaB
MLAALETSTRGCSVALFDLVHDRLVGETFLSQEVEGASALLPALKALMDHQGLVAVDLKGIAVSVGPGSFTGIRVGLATTQGLSLPGGKPVFGVTSFDVLAENLRGEGWTGEALCLMDAQRGECFTGHYQVAEDGFEVVGEPRILAPAAFPDILKGPAIVVGPAALKYEKEIRETLGARALYPTNALHRPSARSVAVLAAKRWNRGERPMLKELQPLYMRVPAPDELKKSK